MAADVGPIGVEADLAIAKSSMIRSARTARAPRHRRACSSVGLERAPDKGEVVGSTPTRPSLRPGGMKIATTKSRLIGTETDFVRSLDRGELRLGR